MKIKLDQVIEAIECVDDIFTSFWDTQTGETVYLADPVLNGEMDEDLATEIENDPERFLRFPTKYEIHEFVKRNAWREKTMKIKKIVWLLLGLVGLELGALGAVLPLLPSVPFLMLALFSFGKSSEKLHSWFTGTKLYRDNLESFVQGQGMTRRAKLKIMGTVTLLMAFGFCMMLRAGLVLPCCILAGIWLAHILYFVFGVKKYNPDQES